MLCILVVLHLLLSDVSLRVLDIILTHLFSDNLGHVSHYVCGHFESNFVTFSLLFGIRYFWDPGSELGGSVN